MMEGEATEYGTATGLEVKDLRFLDASFETHGQVIHLMHP